MRFSSEGSGEQHQPNEFMPPAGAETTSDGGSFPIKNADETLITPGAATEAVQGGFAMPEEQPEDPFGLRASATSGEQQAAGTAGEAAMVESVPKYVELIPPEQPEATAAPAAEGDDLAALVEPMHMFDTKKADTGLGKIFPGFDSAAFAEGLPGSDPNIVGNHTVYIIKQDVAVGPVVDLTLTPEPNAPNLAPPDARPMRDRAAEALFKKYLEKAIATARKEFGLPEETPPEARGDLAAWTDDAITRRFRADNADEAPIEIPRQGDTPGDTTENQ